MLAEYLSFVRPLEVFFCEKFNFKRAADLNEFLTISYRMQIVCILTNMMVHDGAICVRAICAIIFVVCKPLRMLAHSFPFTWSGKINVRNFAGATMQVLPCTIIHLNDQLES